MEQNSQALAGRHAVVTGGARGIGAAVTRALVAHGANVTMLGRSVAPSVDLAGDPHLHYAQADVCEPESLGKAFGSARSSFGPIHVLVNNAGQGNSAPFLKTDFALWRSMMQVNLDGAFHCIHQVLPAMIGAGWGRIVNIASTAGLAGYSYVTAYCAAKHGVVGLTRSLALEVASKGVTVNAICPGYIRTDMTAEFYDSEKGKEVIARKMLAKRLGKPEELDGAILLLSSDASSFMTGSIITVDGGHMVGSL